MKDKDSMVSVTVPGSYTPFGSSFSMDRPRKVRLRRDDVEKYKPNRISFCACSKLSRLRELTQALLENTSTVFPVCHAPYRIMPKIVRFANCSKMIRRKTVATLDDVDHPPDPTKISTMS